ncbi:MAG: RIO1 family regulatory kinase/ATPase, partial [archaeon]
MHEDLQKRIGEFLQKEDLELMGKIAKGYSSEVYLAEKNGRKFALKIEKSDSPRRNMVEKEIQNLKVANSVKVGPKLYAFDLERRIILMEFIDGITFAEFVLGKIPKNKELGKISGKGFGKISEKKELKKIINHLFKQARRLDKARVDHGQLAGKGSNILISKNKNKPVIIDFEKASQQRRPHNETQLQAFFFRNPHS